MVTTLLWLVAKVIIIGFCFLCMAFRVPLSPGLIALALFLLLTESAIVDVRSVVRYFRRTKDAAL